MLGNVLGSGVVVLALLAHTLCLGQASSLRKLTPKERIAYSRNQKFPTSGTLYKDSIGNAQKGFNLKNPVIHGELYTGYDFYVNASGKIVEVVIRKATQEDKDLYKKLFDIEEAQLRGTFEPTKIDCGNQNQRELLIQILKKDRGNRRGPLPPDVGTDRENEEAVVGLLEQCGPPTREMVGDTAIKAIYLVLLHGSRVNQEKYFPLIQSYAENGRLRKQDPAAMEDKLLKATGERQKYGTIIYFSPKTGPELFPIADLSNVDRRRAAVGLPPLEQYLKQLEERYEMEIKR